MKIATIVLGILLVICIGCILLLISIVRSLNSDLDSSKITVRRQEVKIKDLESEKKNLEDLRDARTTNMHMVFMLLLRFMKNYSGAESFKLRNVSRKERSVNLQLPSGAYCTVDFSGHSIGVAVFAYGDKEVRVRLNTPLTAENGDLLREMAELAYRHRDEDQTVTT